ncbi:hypothetical protein ACHAP8_001066 [Fusarium lateritium]
MSDPPESHETQYGVSVAPSVGKEMTARDIAVQAEAPAKRSSQVETSAETAIQQLKKTVDIVHGPAQDVGPDSDTISQLAGPENNFRMDAQKPSDSGWVHALLDIDGSLLPGFANETIRRVGLSPYKGLHVQVKLEMGPYVKPAMKMQFMVRHGSQTHLFAIVIIPLYMILDKPHIADVPTTDKASLHTLLAHRQMDMSGLRSSVKLTDSFPSIGCDKEKHPALGITAKTVRTLRVKISRENVIISKSPLFQQERNTHLQAVREIADAVVARLTLRPQATFRLWFFPGSTFTDHWWQALENIDAYAHPYADMLSCVDDDYSDLAYDNFIMEGIEHPDKPVPSTNIFLDGEQQTVSVMGGAIEEIVLQDDLAIKL